MILSTHAIVGAAIASAAPEHLVAGFALAFLSHFVLDAIPHWEYKLASSTYHPARPLEADMVLGKAFLLDLLKIGADAGLGIVLAVALFARGGTELLVGALVGAAGGMAPDALQFAYFKIRREPLTSLQRFHEFIHTKQKLDGGVKSFLHQAVVAAVVVLAASVL